MNDQHKIALVTGSSRGIGRGIALELARQKFAVIVHGSSDTPILQSTFEEVKSISPSSIRIVAELADGEPIRTMFDTIRDTFGRLDALVNNAAAQNPCPLAELKESDWDRILAINLKAPFLCAQQAIALMRQAGGGKIVNISSVHATDPKRNYAHYSSSKAGLEMLGKCMALELAEYNIQANSIIVGAIGTEMTPPERQAILIPAIPAGRIGVIEEIASLTAFLCGHACDYMTGASITVDGGLTTLGFCASRPDL
jgi:NAD(P)-dependent dehydrogenase (short-subunit alcohol dehydrogenase family)